MKAGLSLLILEHWKDIRELLRTTLCPQFKNLDKIDLVFGRYNLPKVTQRDIDNLNGPIFIKENQSMTNNFPKQKTPGPEDLTGEFWKFKKGRIPILYNFVQKKKKENIS